MSSCLVLPISAFCVGEGGVVVSQGVVVHPMNPTPVSKITETIVTVLAQLIRIRGRLIGSRWRTCILVAGHWKNNSERGIAGTVSSYSLMPISLPTERPPMWSTRVISISCSGLRSDTTRPNSLSSMNRTFRWTEPGWSNATSPSNFVMNLNGRNPQAPQALPARCVISNFGLLRQKQPC
jgi:hypothetical protein